MSVGHHTKNVHGEVEADIHAFFTSSVSAISSALSPPYPRCSLDRRPGETLSQWRSLKEGERLKWRERCVAWESGIFPQTLICVFRVLVPLTRGSSVRRIRSNDCPQFFKFWNRGPWLSKERRADACGVKSKKQEAEGGGAFCWSPPLPSPVAFQSAGKRNLQTTVKHGCPFLNAACMFIRSNFRALVILLLRIYSTSQFKQKWECLGLSKTLRYVSL